jgi:hypothetical protein
MSKISKSKRGISGNRDAEIVSEIISELGGNQFAAMTGAEFARNGSMLVVKFKGSTKFNYMTIALNGRDLYDVVFMKVRAGKVSNETRLEDIYAEDLRAVFEKSTGLRTSVFRTYWRPYR